MPINPKELPPPQRLRYIVEVMAMRARGKQAMKSAEAKRLERARKRAKTVFGARELAKRGPHMGLVDDALYGNSVHLGCRPWEATGGPLLSLLHENKKQANVL